MFGIGEAGLIDKTIKVIKLLEFTLGVGRPDIGDLFYGDPMSGAAMFRSIGDKLGVAYPNHNWLGQASEKYAAQNKLQQVRAKAVADIDQSVGGAISAQAAAVQHARAILKEEREWLAGWPRSVAIVLSYELPGGWLLSKAWQLVACGMAMRKVNNAMAELAKKTLQNAMTLIKNMLNLQNILNLLPKIPGWFDGIVPGMPEIGDLIPKIPALPDIPGLPSLPKWDDLFDGVIPKVPDFSKMFPGLPALGGLPVLGTAFKGLPGLPMIPKLSQLFPALGLPDIPGLLSFPGLDLPSIPGVPGLPSITQFLGAVPGLASQAAVPSLPGAGNMSATAGQLAQLSGGMGGVQQFAQMGQQGAQSLQQMSQAGQQHQDDGAQGNEGAKAPLDLLSLGKNLAGAGASAH